MPNEFPHNDEFLTPREVAQIFSVRTTTIARWARDGRLLAFLTPGGHRRYRREDVRCLLEEQQQGSRPDDAQRQLTEDAVRLYEQGWSIRQVAEKFDYDYSGMRRLLRRHVTLRNPGAGYTDTYRRDQA